MLIFEKKKNIYLIEDCCHSFNLNMTKNQKISDFIFYSPKKIIPELYTGGILKINNKKKIIKNFKNKAQDIKVSYYQFINTFLETNLLSFKRYLKYFFFKMPTFHKLNSIENKKVTNDFLMDKISKKKFIKIKLNKVLKLRKKNYYLWKKILFKK